MTEKRGRGTIKKGSNSDSNSKASQVEDECVKLLLEKQLNHLNILESSIDNLQSTVVDSLSAVREDIKHIKSQLNSLLVDPSSVSPTENELDKRIRDKSHASNIKILFGSEKIFKNRASVLDDLLVQKDFQTIYNIFVAMFIVLGFGYFIKMGIEERKIDFSILTYSFGKITTALKIWGVMFAWSVFGYIWKFTYAHLPYRVNLTLYTLYQCAFCLFSSFTTIGFQLPPASGFIVMCEQVRLSMKLHSFFMCYIHGPPSSRLKKIVNDDICSRMPVEGHIKHFLYFIFCPTLLYRTSYPRTQYVRWSTVFYHLLECAAIIIYTYMIFERFLFPAVQIQPSSLKNGMRMTDLKILMVGIFNTMLPSVLIFVFGFFGFLHCWLNMWSELLQFADREFYKDWWNSNSFPEYYRKWNGVVYDWLYNYVYVDTISLLESFSTTKKYSKALASFFVIQFSAGMHEFILAFALGHWFPALWLTYGGPGILFNYLNKNSRNKTRNNNIFVWFMLLLGTGLLITCYSREYYIRKLHETEELDISQLQFWSRFFTVYSIW